MKRSNSQHLRLLASVFAIVLLGLAQSCKKDEAASSPTPSIESFVPTSGIVGDNVVITGANFSTTAANNTVKFGTSAAAVTQVSNDGKSLIATVPQGAGTGKISITVNGKTGTSADNFQVFGSPAIADFTPKSGVVGTQVTITGINFDTTPTNNTVKFNGTTATVTVATATSLTVTVPQGASTGKITIDTHTLTAISNVDFTLYDITSLSRTSAAIGGPITLSGTFDGSPANNIVKFNGTTATIYQGDANSLSVFVPYGATTGQVTVTVNGSTLTYPTNFTIVSAWTRKTDLPAVAYGGSTFAIGSNGYYCPEAELSGGNFVNMNSLYVYSQSTDTWTKANNVPNGTLRIFSTNGSVYNQASNYLYQYLPGLDSWNSVNVLSGPPGIGYIHVVGANSGKAYLMDASDATYEFDYTGSWTKLGATYNYPGAVNGLNDSSIGSFFLNGDIYYGGGNVYQNNTNTYPNNFYKFTPGTGWTQLNNMPSGQDRLMFSNLTDGHGYCIATSSGSPTFWRYDTSADTWTQLEDSNLGYGSVTSAQTFVLNGKVYVVGGQSNQVWEYDPSK